MPASNISPSAVFRTVDKYKPTLLLDEADTFLKQNEELRGLLNSGHTRDMAKTARSEKAGDSFDIVVFSTWGPKAIALIGKLAGTLEDRSVMVSLVRKTKSDGKVSKIGINFKNQHIDIRRACKRWTNDNFDELIMSEPVIPETNNDRMGDNWGPLLAIADTAGGDWPKLMRESMLNLFDAEEDSLHIKLLMDLREIFKSHPGERIFSADLVEKLNDIDESPWGDWKHGTGITQNRLAWMLREFKVKSKNMRIGGEKPRKAYELDSFKDAFERFIPEHTPTQSVTPLQTNNINELCRNQSVTDKNSVTDEKQDNQLKLRDCYVVTDKKGGEEEETNNNVPEALRGRITPELGKEIYG